MRPTVWRWLALAAALVGVAFAVAAAAAQEQGRRDYASCDARATVPLECMFVGAFAGMGEAMVAMGALVAAALMLAWSFFQEWRARRRAREPARDRETIEREIVEVEAELARVEAELAKRRAPPQRGEG